MPTYEYACTACGHQFEAVQAFSDDPLTSCPECAGRLRKVYGSVGVVFKGSGFYRTDSRSGGSSTLGKASPSKAEKATPDSSKKSAGDSSTSSATSSADSRASSTAKAGTGAAKAASTGS